jgi:hypothetical protein
MIDWNKIERLMLKSFTGGSLTEDEQRQVAAAHKASPKEYREHHARIVNDEVVRKRRFGL